MFISLIKQSNEIIYCVTELTSLLSCNIINIAPGQNKLKGVQDLKT